ncbi:MAG: ribosome silencing factor [Spirochaetaceae bacterium]|jgi:ribosome-associated protein|nr:ribosome silencing factor [Spirochaetaceae bacterium]
MEDIHNPDDSFSCKNTAFELKALLENHKAVDVIVLDLRGFPMWTDFFVIATVTSGAHLKGLKRHIKEFAYANELEIQQKTGRDISPVNAAAATDDVEWDLIDMGGVVVHLMSEKARKFYELENLWNKAGV